MGYILKFRSPNLYTIIILTKIKKGFLNRKEKVKGFFIFMTLPSFKQIESNYCKKEPCERGCIWIIKFFHCLNFKFSHCVNFGHRQYVIIIFSIRTQSGCTRCTHEEKHL